MSEPDTGLVPPADLSHLGAKLHTLTLDQIVKLDRAITVACGFGEGEVTVVVRRGKPRRVAYHFENDFKQTTEKTPLMSFTELVDIQK